MTELTKNVPLIWNIDATETFEKLKKSVTSAPVLRQFDPQRKICVTTDAFQLGITAVTEQEFENGLQPVCLASKTLSPAQQNYAAHDLELFGIVEALKPWR